MSQLSTGDIAAAQPLELSYVSLAGEEVLPATRENVHLLQHAADYQVCVRNLRRSGVGDIFWGMLCGGMGYSMMRFSSANIGLLALGAILVAVGTWLVSAPSPIGTVVDGITLLLVAAWNIMIDVLMISRTGVPNPYWIAIAAAQVGWGIHRISIYKRFAAAAAMQPSIPTLAWLRDLAKATLKAKPGTDATAVQFTRRGWFIYEKWKGRLLPEVGVFVMNSGSFGGNRDVQLASQDGVEIVKQKKILLSRKYKVTMRVRDKIMKVQMPEESLARLRGWLAPAYATPVIAAPSLPPTSD